MGLTVGLDASWEIKVMQGGNPMPGSDYRNAFLRTLSSEGTNHPDKSILEEVFEGGPFLQSKMHAKGALSGLPHTHSALMACQGTAVLLFHALSLGGYP